MKVKGKGSLGYGSQQSGVSNKLEKIVFRGGGGGKTTPFFNTVSGMRRYQTVNDFPSFSNQNTKHFQVFANVTFC